MSRISHAHNPEHESDAGNSAADDLKHKAAEVGKNIREMGGQIGDAAREQYEGFRDRGFGLFRPGPKKGQEMGAWRGELHPGEAGACAAVGGGRWNAPGPSVASPLKYRDEAMVSQPESPEKPEETRQRPEDKPPSPDPFAAIRETIAEMLDYFLYYLSARIDSVKFAIKKQIFAASTIAVAVLAGAGANRHGSRAPVRRTLRRTV